MSNNKTTFGIFAVFIACGLLQACSGTQQAIAPATVKKPAGLIYETDSLPSAHLQFIPGTRLISIANPLDINHINLLYRNVERNIKITSPRFDAVSYAEDHSRFILTTGSGLQVLTLEGKQLHAISGKAKTLSALSDDGRLIYYDGVLWDSQTAQPLFQLPELPIPTSYRFSEDGRYFAVGDDRKGVYVLDLELKEIRQHYPLQGVSAIAFDSRNNIYISYGADISFGREEYMPRYISVFTFNHNKAVATYTAPISIRCWNLLDDETLYVALNNGELNTLSARLWKRQGIQFNHRITSCIKGDSKRVWLGTRQSGVFVYEPEDNRVRLKLKKSAAVKQLALSGDEVYIGIVSSQPAKTHIEIYATAGLR